MIEIYLNAFVSMVMKMLLIKRLVLLFCMKLVLISNKNFFYRDNF